MFNKKKIIIPLVVFGALVLAGCTSTGDNKADPKTKDSGKIEAMGALSGEWGDINIQGGNAEKEFKFKNIGEEPLVLKGALTSCMCTNAVIELPDGSRSPEFGMHTKVEWAHAIQPGEEFTVDIEFDPLAHGPNGVGPISRAVYLFSSSKENGEVAQLDEKSGEAVTIMQMSGEVLYEKDYMEKYSGEPFSFEEKEYDFGVLKQSGGLVSYDFPFTYNGEEPLSVTAVPSSCACTTAEISQNEFKKGDSGVLKVTFDPNLHEEPEGKFFKTVTIMTDPKLEKQPEVKVWAEIDLDLGPEAYKLQEDHED